MQKQLIEKRELLKSIEKDVELGAVMKKVMLDIVEQQHVYELETNERGGERE